MFLTVKQAAQTLNMEPHQVYYLHSMGEIESIKIGKACRLTLESVDDYAKRYPDRKTRDPSGYFIYSGNGGYLFSCLPDYLPSNPHGQTTGMEGRRGKLVHRTQRPDRVLLSKLKPINQLDLFSA